MSAEGNSLKLFLEERRRAVADAHRRGATGFASCAALTAMMDEAVTTAFLGLPASDQHSIAVVALGGYGRGELFPHSDLDIMILCPSGEQRGRTDQHATTLLHSLWDAGFDVSHSVRTVDEVEALQGVVLDAWTSTLESRFVCGNRSLFERMRARVLDAVSAGPDTWLIEGVFTDAQTRHDRYGNSVKLLEPNVKKSSGGLRDLHNLYWLYRGNDPRFYAQAATGESATQAFLGLLRETGSLDEEDHAAAIRAVDFLFRTRHEVHWRQATLHDTLEYALQRDIAEGLGYEGPTLGETGGRAVERFMREYYRHARTVFRLHRRLSQRFRELVDSGRRVSLTDERVNGMFLLTENGLTVDSSVRVFDDAVTLFDAFVLAAERDIDLDYRLRSVIERSVELITDGLRGSPALAQRFQRILRSSRVAPTLHAMNDLGILERYVPEFGDLVAFFQHNVYHYYTADEHTLIAIQCAEALRMEQGLLHEVFRNLREKDMLYLAILLHDIGKPHGVADHEITGIEIARTVLHRLGLDALFPDVSFLVRNHLLMEQIAFRRNIHDPDTIKEFAARFERPDQLDYLYVLTYADLSAVNTGVWTGWKAAMLQELYQHGLEVLQRNLRGEQIDEFHQARHEAATDRVLQALSPSIPREEVERHLQGMQNDAYVALFSEEEIGQHILRSTLTESVTTMFAHAEEYTEVTVISRDAPYTLSKFCAVLSANDANIFDATIFTRNDGVIIDRFRVAGAASRRHLEQRVCEKITDDLRKVVEGALDIDHLFNLHRRRWKRKPRTAANPNIRMDVVFEDTPAYTIVDVYAPDAVGFLYRVTETMSRLGLDIYFAKIATRGDGIVDAFYVLDREGKKINGRFRREAIRTEILGTISALSEEELGV